VLSEGPPPEDLAQALGGLQTLATGHVHRSARRIEVLTLSRPIAAVTATAASAATASAPAAAPRAVCR
jgi:hypothetical protein